MDFDEDDAFYVNILTVITLSTLDIATILHIVPTTIPMWDVVIPSSPSTTGDGYFHFGGCNHFAGFF